MPIDSLGGITIREFDWGPLTRGLRPTLDPLASVIPADQHAVFFPSVVATLNTMQELERAGLAVVQMATVTSTNDRIAHRYQRQLGILNPDLGRLLPPTLVTGVAMTGSDLYFDTGTDTAAIYATEQPEQVAKLLSASWGIIKTANPEAAESRESIAGVACRVLRSPDRVVSAYLAERPGLVILANSPVQIRRIVEVQSGKSPALAGSPEYVYFRDRYRRTDADESAFAILPDAAIRRWCGPKWRIAHHRRIMTGSALAAAQASHLVEMQSLKEPRSVDETGLGPITVSNHGVYSTSLGSRLFQTPIAEVDLDVVTKTEADAYRQWRDSYQQNWSRYFDPIAVRVAIKPDHIGVDLSVMPLIERSRYGELVSVSAGAKLPPTAGDPHPESLVHFVIGFNRQSESFQETIRQLDSFTTREDNSATVRSWVGDWLTLYADEDPLWDEFVKDGSNYGFWEKKGVQIPIGIAIAVHDADKRAQFQKRCAPCSFGTKRREIRTNTRAFPIWKCATRPCRYSIRSRSPISGCCRRVKKSFEGRSIGISLAKMESPRFRRTSLGPAIASGLPPRPRRQNICTISCSAAVCTRSAERVGRICPFSMSGTRSIRAATRLLSTRSGGANGSCARPAASSFGTPRTARWNRRSSATRAGRRNRKRSNRRSSSRCAMRKWGSPSR